LRHVALVVMLVAVTASSGRAASLSNPQALEQELRQVVLKNFAAGDRQNLAESMQALHTQSPAYVPTYQATQQTLSLFRLHTELVYFRYVGEDEGFVFAHVKQKTTKIAGPPFRDNVTDSLYVFRQEDQEWKIWAQVVLGTDYLDSPK
jgi:hypothetical protein